MEPVIAIIYDCDGTLARDTSYFLLESHGVDTERFWREVARQVEKGWDPPLAYLNRILSLVREDGPLAGLTREGLRERGAAVELFPGLPGMFPELDEMLAGESRLKDTGIRLEHYLVSSGIAELLRGLRVAPFMTDIFGCEFEFAPETGRPVTVKSSISFTEKTKFIYAINKGIPGERMRAHPYAVNDVVPEAKRRVPFRNMIYVGDGPSDIPCFSMITANGGDGIGVNERPRRGYELAKGRRTTTGPYSPDYRPGSDMRRALEAAILDKAYGISLDLRR